ncbi:unnamed protein product [Alternaria alternata]
MAREKRIAHKSPNSLERRITKRHSVSVGFAAQIVDEAQKSKCQADLEKARSILDRRQKGQPVSWVELEWTKTLCAREAKLEGAEMKDVTATDTKKQQWQQDQERKIQEISAANRALPLGLLREERRGQRCFPGTTSRSLPPPMSDANNNMTAKRNADEDSDVDIWDDDVWALMIKAD